ncbi:MAG: amidohydrolase family protein [Acidobacteriota bacterium]
MTNSSRRRCVASRLGRLALTALLVLGATTALADDWLIRAAHWHDGEQDRGAGRLKVEGSRIAWVGPDSGPLPSGDDVLDVAWAIPGLIDLRSGAGRRGPQEEASEVTPLVQSVDLLDPTSPDFERCLRAGITTVAVEPGNRAVVGGQVSVLKTDARPLDQRTLNPGAALWVTLGWESVIGNYAPRNFMPLGLHARRPTTRMGVASTLRRALELAEPMSSTEQAVIGRARSGRWPTFMQARKEVDIRTALGFAASHGLRPVLVEATEAYRHVELIAEAGAPVVLGPFYGQPRIGAEFWEGDDHRLATASLLAEGGVPVAIGTGRLTDPDDLRTAASLAARHGLDDDLAVAAITRVPAEILGLSHRLGQLRAGSDADVVLLDGPPLSPGSRVVGVLVEGRLAWSAPSLLAPASESTP